MSGLPASRLPHKQMLTVSEKGALITSEGCLVCVRARVRAAPLADEGHPTRTRSERNGFGRKCGRRVPRQQGRIDRRAGGGRGVPRERRKLRSSQTLVLHQSV